MNIQSVNEPEDNYTAMQRQTAVTAYFLNKQLLFFVFVRSTSIYIILIFQWTIAFIFKCGCVNWNM